MMSRMIPFVALLVLLGQAPEASAQDDARALVAKAIQAAGGEDKLSQVAAVHLRLKGILTEVDSAPFTGEVQRQGTDRLRYARRADVSGEVLTMITVVNGANVWIKVNEQEEIVTEATRKALERSGHADQVARLLPLIRDPRFNLTSLGESTREGRPVLGVKVEGKGEPEVRLFFDKANGLLFRVEYRGVDDESGKEFDAAVVHEEYRELGATAAEEASFALAVLESRFKAMQTEGVTMEAAPANYEQGAPAAPGQAARQGEPERRVMALVEFSGLKQWQEIRAKLMYVPGLQALEVDSLSARGASITFDYAGSLGRLQQVLAENGFSFENAEENFIIRAR